MLAAIPPTMLRFNQRVEHIQQDERAVALQLADGTTAEHDLLVGADGIDSLVRRTLWGDAPKREHRPHVFGGFTFTDVPGTRPNMSVLTHSPTVQGSWTSTRHKGHDGHQWWVLTATDPDAPAPTDPRAAAATLAAAVPALLPGLIDATDPAYVQRWVLRDRPRLKQWSKGRATLVGDAAHPTSPCAAVMPGPIAGRRAQGSVSERAGMSGHRPGQGSLARRAPMLDPAMSACRHLGRATIASLIANCSLAAERRIRFGPSTTPVRRSTELCTRSTSAMRTCACTSGTNCHAQASASCERGPGRRVCTRASEGWESGGHASRKATKLNWMKHHRTVTVNALSGWNP